jgi:hypothetical protein
VREKIFEIVMANLRESTNTEIHETQQIITDKGMDRLDASLGSTG